MKQIKTVDEYINSHQGWQQELELLREIILSNPELNEEVKWGAPIYTLKGKNIVGIGAFKSYVGLWFHQGVFLKDYKKVLINAQEGKTKALRQWRFNSINDVDSNTIKKYVEEAIHNQKAGKELKPEVNSNLTIPVELQSLFNGDTVIKSAYDSLTLYKQKEFAEYIASAKKTETKLSRIEKIKPMILSNTGLNDKYR